MKPFRVLKDFIDWGIFYMFLVREKPSPIVRIRNAEVVNEKGRAFLKAPIEGVKAEDVWITPVADSNSMDPWFDKEDKVVLVPASVVPPGVGDVIVFRKFNRDNDLIIHQVVSVDFDEKGLYFITKGLNNFLPDPFRVRRSWILWVMVAVLY